MSSSKLGFSGVLFGGTAWTKQLKVVKYSTATGKTMADRKMLDEENLDQVIHAIGGDGIIAELECYRHPLWAVSLNAGLPPATEFKNWCRDLKYKRIESYEQLNDDQQIGKTLNRKKRTKRVLYHSFVVFKVIQEKSDSTEDLWCSIEKNSTCLLLQYSDNKDDVKLKKIGKKRIEKVKALSHDFEHVGQKSVQDLLNFIKDEKELDNQYHLLEANCQIFAEKIISNFKIESPSSRNWYDFQKIIHLWSTSHLKITPTSCPSIIFSIKRILYLTEIGHMPSKMSRNYRLTFRKTLIKVIEKLRGIVATGSCSILNDVDNQTLQMILKGLEEFSSVLEEETINGFVFLFWMGRSINRLDYEKQIYWMGRSLNRLDYEEQILTNVNKWHTESMAEEYRKYKERISLLNEAAAPTVRPSRNIFSLSKALSIAETASPATEGEISSYFDSTRPLIGNFHEFTTRDPADFSAVYLENDSIAQNETREREPAIEETEWLSNIEILRRLYEESKDLMEDDWKISPSNEREADVDCT